MWALRWGPYDPTRPLVIDPVLSYSSYLGGNSSEAGLGVAVDASGNIYLTGETFSTDFPTTVGALQTSSGGGNDAFVMKLNPAGPNLVYSTYFGGSGFESAKGIELDALGNAYITGETRSTDFPATPGAYKTTLGGSRDAFVAKVNPSGSALIYATYVGGGGIDEGFGIAVDGAGNAYITGGTQSGDFPTTLGAFQTTIGGRDAFVTKVNANGTALIYSTYLGGNLGVGGGSDDGQGIAVDASGNAYVTGQAVSTNFPTTPGAFQTTFGGFADAYVTKVNDAGTGLVYSTYLGGSASEEGFGIAVDASGKAYVTGETVSTNFPTTPGAPQTTFGGGTGDAFVTKLNDTGTGVVYSTYLGGDGSDNGRDIAVDASGNASITGKTFSTNFPTTPDALQTTSGGSVDAIVTKLNTAGDALMYSSYFGGSSQDEGFAIAVDGAGNAYVAGLTKSINLPTANPLQAAYGGGFNDAFVAKIGTASTPSTIFEDFESTPAGSLPSGWSAFAGNPAVESGTTADDGSVGNALFLRPGGTWAAEVPGAPSDGFRVEVDLFHSSIGVPGFIHFRGPDLDNGYRAGILAGNQVFIRKVVNGVETTLALASVPNPSVSTGPQAGKWYHLIAQVEGNQIRVFETKSSADLVVTDDTFPAGPGDRLFLGATNNTGRSVAFDNLSIESAIPHEPASLVSLPFLTGFESSERFLRNGVQLPPNVDAFDQGGSYLAATADDGSAGEALFVQPLGTSAMEVPGAPSDDFRVEVDLFHSSIGVPGFIHFRGPDLNNGYRAGILAGNQVFIRKVVNGVETTLALASVPNLSVSTGPQAGKWYHLIAQVEGNQIRVFETKSSADLVVTDDTFPAGPGDRLFLGATNNTGRSVAFDNLSIESAIPHEPASLVSLPFLTGFESSERFLRNGVQLPPNVDAFDQGGSYLAATADDGSAGEALFVQPLGTSAMEVPGAPSDDFRVEVDLFHSSIGVPGFIHFRGPDLNNGYRAGILAGNQVFIRKVVNGVETTLALASVPNLSVSTGPQAGKWYHLIAQVEGNQIRVFETKSSADLVVTDDTFPARTGGSALLGGDQQHRPLCRL